MSMGERLKKARKHIGLTQDKLGEKYGIKQHSIKAMEIGQQKISTDFAEDMEKDFSINGWWLLTGKGEMMKQNCEILTEDERQLLESYRKLSDERKKWYYFKIVAESLE